MFRKVTRAAIDAAGVAVDKGEAEVEVARLTGMRKNDARLDGTVAECKIELSWLLEHSHRRARKRH